MRLFYYTLILYFQVQSQNFLSPANNSFGFGFWQDSINPSIYYQDSPSYINFASLNLYEINELNKSIVDIYYNKLNTGIVYQYFNFQSYIEQEIELRSYLSFGKLKTGFKIGFESKKIGSVFDKIYSKYSLSFKYPIYSTILVSEIFYDGSEKKYSQLFRVIDEFNHLSTQFILTQVKSEIDTYFLADYKYKDFLIGLAVYLDTFELGSQLSYTVTNITFGIGLNFNEYLGMSKSLNIAFLL